MVEVTGTPKDSFQVVGRPTSVDGWVRIGELHSNWTDAVAARDAALGLPDNYYEVTILGAGSGVYRAS